MFKLRQEKGACLLIDIKTNIAVASLELSNLFFIADVVKRMREAIANGKNEDGFYTDFLGSPRRLGKNMEIIRKLVDAGLEKGAITNMAAVTEE